MHQYQLRLIKACKLAHTPVLAPGEHPSSVGELGQYRYQGERTSRCGPSMLTS